MADETPTSVGDLILAIEKAKEGITALTELRKTFIEQGWSEQGAESMVYAMTMTTLGRS